MDATRLPEPDPPQGKAVAPPSPLAPPASSVPPAQKGPATAPLISAPARGAASGTAKVDPSLIGGRYRLVPDPQETPTGQIHLADDVHAEGQQALVKIVPGALFPSPMLADRALRELRQLGKVTSPRVMRVLGQGKTPAGQIYVAFALPPSDAEPLDALVEQSGPMPLGRARRLAQEIGEALAEAQQVGVVHRDLAPHCIYVYSGEDGQEQVVVLDFALTEVSEFGGRIVQGAPGFLSPEQVEGKSVDQRSMVFSLGALLYYMLAGTPPFGGSGKSREEVMTQVTAHPAPLLSTRIQGVPSVVDQLLSRAMEKSPSRRQLTLRQLLNEMAELSGVEAQVAGGAKAAPARTLIGIPVFASSAKAREPGLSGAPGAGQRPVQLTGAPKRPLDPAFAADGWLEAAAEAEAPQAAPTAPPTALKKEVSRPQDIPRPVGKPESSRPEASGIPRPIDGPQKEVSRPPPITKMEISRPEIAPRKDISRPIATPKLDKPIDKASGPAIGKAPQATLDRASGPAIGKAPQAALDKASGPAIGKAPQAALDKPSGPAIGKAPVDPLSLRRTEILSTTLSERVTSPMMQRSGVRVAGPNAATLLQVPVAVPPAAAVSGPAVVPAAEPAAASPGASADLPAADHDKDAQPEAPPPSAKSVGRSSAALLDDRPLEPRAVPIVAPAEQAASSTSSRPSSTSPRAPSGTSPQPSSSSARPRSSSSSAGFRETAWFKAGELADLMDSPDKPLDGSLPVTEDDHNRLSLRAGEKPPPPREQMKTSPVNRLMSDKELVAEMQPWRQKSLLVGIIVLVLAGLGLLIFSVLKH